MSSRFLSDQERQTFTTPLDGIKIHPLIDLILKKHVSLRVEYDDGITWFCMDGFYKSGSIKMAVSQIKGQPVLCESRYGQRDYLQTWDDLVRLNHVWFERSKNRGWDEPDDLFKDEFIRLGLAKPKKITKEVW